MPDEQKKPLPVPEGSFNSLIARCTPVRLLYKTCRALRERGLRYTLAAIGWQLRKLFGYVLRRKTNLYSKAELRRQSADQFSVPIRFSIVVPLYNTPKKYLREMIASVKKQTYPDWELCLADGSDDAHGEVERICRRFAEEDKRINYKRLKTNLGISGNTNAALDMAKGDYIALLDHDDLLHPAALYAVMRAIVRENADFIYTDEGTFLWKPEYISIPHFKSDYAPDSLRGINYICHFTVFRRSLLERTGGFRPECNGSQDYDMVLRLTEKAEKIFHIPELLYYWRAHDGSTAQGTGIKPYVSAAGIRALKDHLTRIGAEGEVTETEHPTIYRIRYRLKDLPLVSVIIPNRDHKEDLEKCLRSLTERTTYPNWEIIIVENGSTAPETWAYYEELRSDERIRVVTWEGGFNYPAVNRFGVSFAGGDYFLLLNNDTEIITPSWIEEMLMFAQRDDVGAVGAKLYYADGSIQHGGVAIGHPAPAAHYHAGLKRDEPGYMGRLCYAQNLSAVTGACMMIPRRVWEQVGGLDESYAVTYNDIDLCMRIRKAGYLVVWTPFAELYHYESLSRGYEDTPEKLARFKREAALFRSRWKKELEISDPYYNPNFVPDRSDFTCDLPKNAKGRIRAKEGY